MGNGGRHKRGMVGRTGTGHKQVTGKGQPGQGERHRRGTGWGGVRRWAQGKDGDRQGLSQLDYGVGQPGYGGAGARSGYGEAPSRALGAASAHLEGAVVVRGQVAQVVLGRPVPPRLLLHQRCGLTHTGRQAGGQPARRPGPSLPPPRPRTHRLPHARRLVALVEVRQRVHHDIPGHQPWARHLGCGHCACALTSRPMGEHTPAAKAPPPAIKSRPSVTKPRPFPARPSAQAPPLPVDSSSGPAAPGAFPGLPRPSRCNSDPGPAPPCPVPPLPERLHPGPAPPCPVPPLPARPRPLKERRHVKGWIDELLLIHGTAYRSMELVIDP